MEYATLPNQPASPGPDSRQPPTSDRSATWMWVGVGLAILLGAIALYLAITASNDSEDALDTTTQSAALQSDVEDLQAQVAALSSDQDAAGEQGAQAADQQVAALDERIDSLAAQVTTLSNKVDAQSGQIDDLPSAADLNQLEQRVEALEQQAATPPVE